MIERELSVIIPTCNRPDVLRRTLEALLHQQYDPRSMEAIVVVDGADVRSVEVAGDVAAMAPFPIHVLTQPRSGQGTARNAAVRRATGRIIVMLDDDIIADPELLAAHARHHVGREDMVVTGSLPVQALDPEPAHHRALREWWEHVLLERASPTHRATFRDFVTGNVSVPRSRLLEMGGFDADFTGYGREDYELGHRLLRSGLHFVHEPRARGLHLYAKTLTEWLRQFRAQGRADVIFCRKHPELAGEIMTLSPFPTVPWLRPLVWSAERAASVLGRRGGKVWKRAAATAQAAHYWRGVREEATKEELRMLVHVQLDTLRARTGKAGVMRVALARVGGWL